jgi:hypothetical protein
MSDGDGLPVAWGTAHAPHGKSAAQRWVERFQWLLEQTGQPAYVYAANHDLTETQVSRWRNGKTMPTEFALDALLRSLQPPLADEVVAQTWDLWVEAAKVASRYEYEKYVLRRDLRQARQQVKNVGAYAETLRSQRDTAEAEARRLREQVEELVQDAGRAAVLSQMELDRKDQQISDLEGQIDQLKAELGEVEQNLQSTNQEIEALGRTEDRATEHAEAVLRQLRALEEAAARQLPPGPVEPSGQTEGDPPSGQTNDLPPTQVPEPVVTVSPERPHLVRPRRTVRLVLSGVSVLAAAVTASLGTGLLHFPHHHQDNSPDYLTNNTITGSKPLELSTNAQGPELRYELTSKAPTITSRFATSKHDTGALNGTFEITSLSTDCGSHALIYYTVYTDHNQPTPGPSTAGQLTAAHQQDTVKRNGINGPTGVTIDAHLDAPTGCTANFNVDKLYLG